MVPHLEMPSIPVDEDKEEGRRGSGREEREWEGGEGVRGRRGSEREGGREGGKGGW